MRRFIFLMLVLSSWISLLAQESSPNDAELKIYRATATRINDLVHTKLDVKFDYDKSYLYGKAWITLKPHYFSTDSLLLDAKGMDIHHVSMMTKKNNQTLIYTYDGSKLNINLGKIYKRSESYTIYIEYTSKPNELKGKGSSAISDDRGLYFINPKGIEKDKPTQIWTQGESESNSAWFPTIDKPNQKSTEEIIMTVSSKYVTLSNGNLISQKNNGNGTRTDDWRMDLPHAPYLFFIGVGDYAIVKDSYKGMEVNYYVDRGYEKVARRIFGLTPEMMAFYSRTLGVDFPWPKYDQMIAHDFVSGSMENTTSTLHGEHVQQDARQLSDGNKYENDICHELFHQWFGDLVTAESWSNLTLNESFANFSETIWTTYKEGKDAGDAVNYIDMERYLQDSSNASKNLVRFYYVQREDMFDAVTYSKGGRILNMLKNYLGDSAFYKSLNRYLTSKKFNSAEAQDLRLAFEEVTGQDLNWYWNQWYYGSGHPKFIMDYHYDDEKAKGMVIIRQIQNTGKIFRIPLTIDVYNGILKTRYPFWINNLADTFTFSYKQRPSLINVDGDKIILCEKEDNKTLDNFIFQYTNAGLYVDRLEAIDYCAKHQDNEKARRLLEIAIKDPFFDLRIKTMDHLNMGNDTVRRIFEPFISDLAANDSNRLVRDVAIRLLGTYHDPAYKTLFLKATGDSSYYVSGRALEALDYIDSAKALELAKKFAGEPAKDKLAREIFALLCKSGNEESFEMLFNYYDQIARFEKLRATQDYTKYLSKINENDKLKKGVDLIVKSRESIPPGYHKFTNSSFNDPLRSLADKKMAAGLTGQADYINAQLK
jgi:aminopeptidase N